MSVAPVVIVAVKVVLAERAAEGVKVAVLVDSTYVTAPATLAAPGPPNVKVEVLIVAGFIALLNTAVITTGLALGQTPTLPSGGVTKVTVGGVRGSPGFPVPGLLLVPQHPANTMASRNAGFEILLIKLRISFSSSPSCKAFSTAIFGPGDTGNFRVHWLFVRRLKPLQTMCIYQSFNLLVCSILNTRHIKL